MAVVKCNPDEREQDNDRGLSKRLALSVQDVVVLSGLGRTLVFAAIKNGHLVARKCGRRTIVLRPDLHRWLNSLPRSDGAEGALE
jgi:hypothetical protein